MFLSAAAVISDNFVACFDLYEDVVWVCDQTALLVKPCLLLRGDQCGMTQTSAGDTETKLYLICFLQIIPPPGFSDIYK